MRTIAFFNNKGGVGKTSLVYHVSNMCAELGACVLVADLDPQSNLTAMFLDELELEEIWPDEGGGASVLACIRPIIEGLGDIGDAPLRKVAPGLHLLPGDLGLSRFEDRLSESWPKCLDGDIAAFRVTTAFYRILHAAARESEADIVLIDIGPNLGAINRSALIAADHVVMPLTPGLFSLQGLRNLGPTLHDWRVGWKKRLEAVPDALSIPMPSGAMRPAGYVIMQHVERRNRPVKAYQRWISQIPGVYRSEVLRDKTSVAISDPDPNCVGYIKNYQSLMPLAEDARKPIFRLTPADGAIGAHAAAVSKCYLDFGRLARDILGKCSEHAPDENPAGAV